MIYSPSKKVIFIHVQRSGGTSIEHLFQLYYADTIGSVGGVHSPAINVRAILGIAKFEQCYRFGFIRNPWDRMVSWYSWSQQHACPNWERKGMTQPKVCFEQFLENDHPTLWRSQLDFYVDGNDVSLVNDIFRFEDYDIATKKICKQLGLDSELMLHARPSRHEHYSHYYNDYRKQIVMERCAKDIAYGNYEFESL